MDNRQRVEASIRARHRMFVIWNPDDMRTKKMKLLVRAFSVVKADRIEDAIMNESLILCDRI